MTAKNLTPPSGAAIGKVYDANAFSIGKFSALVHRPAHYPNANMVVAVCGAYAYAVERPTRIAEWRDAEWNCSRCLEGA